MKSRFSQQRTSRIAKLAAAVTAAGAVAIACGSAPESDTAADPVGSTSEAISYGWSGFAWAQQATGTYTASSAYSYNAGLGAVTVTQTGTGTYRVDFPHLAAQLGAYFSGLLGSGGNAQVVAYGGGNARCEVAGWGNNASTPTTLSINVACHAPGGAAANSTFVVSWAAPDGNYDGRGAFLWADTPSATKPYNPMGMYSWNSIKGAVNTVTHSGPGAYSILLGGQASSGGHVEVTAYGSRGENCKVWGWGASGNDEQVLVLCFDAKGAAADSYFTLNYNETGEVGEYDVGAYAWANDTTSASYSPSANYSYDSGVTMGTYGSNTAGHRTVAGNSAGAYFIRHSLLSAINSSVHVTAYGGDPSYCKVVGWGTATGGGVEVDTQCYSATGTPQDTRYTESYLTWAELSPPPPPPPCGQTGTMCCAPANCSNGGLCDIGTGLCSAKCNALNDPCCFGTSCGGNLTCDPITKKCAPPCGGTNQPCCGGNGCLTGLSCSGGTCVGPAPACTGAIGTPCCSGKCASNSWCDSGTNKCQPMGDTWVITCACVDLNGNVKSFDEDTCFSANPTASSANAQCLALVADINGGTNARVSTCAYTPNTAMLLSKANCYPNFGAIQVVKGPY